MTTDLTTLVVALVAGYLAGSVSWSRILGRGVDFTRTQVTVTEGGETLAIDGASPAMLTAHRGLRSGLTAALLDITKAVLAVVIARALAGDEAAAMAGLGAVVGHIWPLWHRFSGGYGISPLVGASLALDPLGFAVAMVAGGAVGTALGYAWVMTKSWPFFLIAWAAVMRPAAMVAFIAVATTVHVLRGARPTAAALRSMRADRRPWRERIKDVRTYPAIAAVPSGTAGDPDEAR
jgi:glycerol-3-phosphate acyltransferase PlsY